MWRWAEAGMVILMRLGSRLGLACIPVLFVVSASWCALAAEGGDLDDLENRITYFYKNPDLGSVPNLLRKMDQAGLLTGRRSQASLMAGFMVPLFESHPERIDELIAGPYSRDVERVVWLGLAFAGMNEKAMGYMQRNGWPQKNVDAVKRATGSLLEFVISDGRDLDMLWAASFASGDVRYPLKIVRFIAESLASGKFWVEDIDFVGDHRNTMRAGGPEMERIAGRYPGEDLERLALNGSALWSLGSNAKQHEFVMETVQERIAAAPDSDLAFLLRKTVFRATAASLARFEGKAFEGLVGLTPQETFGGEGKAFEASVDTFKSSARIEFAAGQPAFIAVLARLPVGDALEFSLDITSPGGRTVGLGPFTWRAEEAGVRTRLGAVRIPPPHLKEEGIYTVRGSFRASGEGAVTTENRAFIGSR